MEEGREGWTGSRWLRALRGTREHCEMTYVCVMLYMACDLNTSWKVAPTWQTFLSCMVAIPPYRRRSY